MKRIEIDLEGRARVQESGEQVNVIPVGGPTSVKVQPSALTESMEISKLRETMEIDKLRETGRYNQFVIDAYASGPCTLVHDPLFDIVLVQFYRWGKD